jgi:hypothetical protein
MNIVV